MAIKYEVLFTDVSDVDHKVEISNPDYSGAIQSITGSVKYGMNTAEDARHPIRSKSMVLELLATKNDDFEDLIESDERDWAVTYYRDNQKAFFGYLTSEGVIQDYYRSERYIVFDVLGPLAFLEDLAYVDNIGSSYVGDEQVLKVIAKCLKRSFEPGSVNFFDIVDFVPYDYRSKNITTGNETDFVTGRFLKDNVIDQNQYIDDETQNIQSCMTVLTRLLSSLDLCVCQVEGRAWVIYHYLHDMSTINALYTNEYDFDGNDTTGVNVSPFSTILIVTDNGTNHDQLLHANSNQQFFEKRGVQELLTNFEFVYKKGLLKNSSFDGGVNGGAMPDWILGADYAEATNQGHLKIMKFDTGNPNTDLAAQSNSNIAVDVNNLIKLSGRFQPNFDDCLFYFNVRLDAPSQANPYYLQYVGEQSPIWVVRASAETNVVIKGVNGETTEFEYELPKIPAFGEITVEIFAVRNEGAQTVADNTTFVELYNLDFEGSQLNTTGTSYQTKVVSGRTLKAEKIETYFDTNPFNITSNQFLKLNIEDPIVSIRDTYHGSGFEKLGAIVSKNYMKSKRRRKVFTGDILGYFDPIKYLSIPDLSNSVFVVLEYSYDAPANITTVKLIEKDNSALPVTQTQSVVYANTITPTIVS